MQWIIGQCVTYLAMGECSDSHVPSSVRNHNKTKERPKSVVAECWHQYCQHATSSKYVGPFSLVQVVIQQKDIAAKSQRVEEKQILIVIGVHYGTYSFWQYKNSKIDYKLKNSCCCCN